MKFNQFMRVKRVQWKQLVSVATATMLAGSYLSISMGILAIGTTIGGVLIAPTAVALARSAEERKADRNLNKAERQLEKRDKAQAKADKHDAKAGDALNKAEGAMKNSKGVVDRGNDPGCNQPGVQC